MQELLKEEVTLQVEGMRGLELGTKEYSETVTGITKLSETVIKLKATEIEQRKVELQLKQEEFKIKQEEQKTEQARLEREDKLKQEAEKAEQARLEREDKLNQQKEQLGLQQKQLDEQTKQNKSNKIRDYIQVGIVILGTVAGIVLPIWGTIEDQKREREGEMVTSYSGKKHRDGLYTKK